MDLYKLTFVLAMISIKLDGFYGIGHGNCSICTRVNSVQYGGFTRKIHAVKVYTNNYTKVNLHARCVYLSKENFLSFTRKLLFFFLVADLREIIRCRSITVSSHFNFSKNIGTEIILNHVFHFQNSFITGLPVGQTQLLLRFSVVSAEKRTPGEGNTRGSGTEKRWSYNWFHTIFPCTDPCTNIFCTPPPPSPPSLLPRNPEGVANQGYLRCSKRFDHRSHFMSFVIVLV